MRHHCLPALVDVEPGAAPDHGTTTNDLAAVFPNTARVEPELMSWIPAVV